MWRERQRRKGGGGSQRKSSPAHDNKQSKIKISKGGVDLLSRSRSGGATPALPLPTKSFLSLSFAPPFPEKTGEEMLAEPSLSPPQAVPPPLSFFLFLSFPRHLILSLISPFSLLASTIFIPPSFCIFSPNSPPNSSCLTLLNQQHVGLMETRS